MENEEQIKYPVMKKQMHAAGTPFKVLNKVPRENWESNYSYYLSQKAKGESLRPLLGRMVENQFQVYLDGAWVDKNLWDDYSEEVIENGEPVKNAKGNVRRRAFFDNKKEYLVEFDMPVPIEIWDKELKQVVTEEHTTAYIRLSKSLAGKLIEQFEDPRNSDETFFVIKYDRTASPAEQYKVQFHH